jgi:quercetin dioxygenase-like cupin family protein
LKHIHVFEIMLCATYELAVPWLPGKRGERYYCREGSAAGGPYCCSYAALPRSGGKPGRATAVKAEDFRIVLTTLHVGTRLQEHHAAGSVAIQTLSGHVRLRVGSETTDLPAGHLLALAADTAHDVEALEDSVFLVTLAWPASHRDH